MYGEIETKELTLLLSIFVWNRENMDHQSSFLADVMNGLLHSKISNSVINALTNIEAHYDLGIFYYRWRFIQRK